MFSLFQFLDPGAVSPYADSAIIVAVYFLLERRLRKVENQLSRLLGEEEGRREVKR